MSDQHPVPPYGGTPEQPGPQLAVPQPPRKNFFARHKVLTTVLALVVVFIVVKAAGGGSGDSSADPGAAAAPSHAAAKSSGRSTAKSATKSSAPAAPKKAAKQAPGIGDAVRDGKFEFVVTKVDKPVHKIGDEYLNETAQGEFLKVHMTVKNIGKVAQTFDDSAQKLKDSKGREFSSDSEAAIYLDDSNSFLNEINPGNSVKGIVVFDVPKGTVATSIELHDSIFSGGVKVSLR